MSNVFQDQINVQQLDSHTYQVGFDAEWAIGPMLHGGCVTASVYAAAQKHFTSTLASRNQPDVHTLHIEFLRPVTLSVSTIKITDLKVGKGTNFIQLTLSQNNESKCTALATSTNFDVPLGPTATIDTSSPSAASLPGLCPIPDFKKIEAQERDPNWIPSKTVGELLPLLKRMTFLYPVPESPPGILDFWITFDAPEKFSGVHLAMLADMAASPSDTLLRTGGTLDMHKIHAIKKDAWEKNPGKTLVGTNSVKEASKSQIWNSTLTIDVQFKRRVTGDVRWTFTRATTRMLEGGRMDQDLDIRDENLKPLCLSRQVMLVIDARRRFKEKGGRGKGSNL
ncbi:thioesterase family protein [Zopfia rhizophila CBS 207.26]|uniref:Thioesterase family protein n=1 Tax=Zopfia rhizophila CBS 207.26 TaxID=1314779 RepID=A0A6A6DFQ7_9PEZI|nr:thioesterase family protein [Zopfia rhizophila CBS 207.26]